MNSLPVAALGSQRPNRWHLPAGTVTSAGDDCIELAESAGLILDDWQKWFIRHALGERADGKWAAFLVCLIVPRQNGKGAILEAIELYHLFVLGTPLIVHTAHIFDTAFEHFLRLQGLIENVPDLKEQVEYFHVSHADTSIKLWSGPRINFKARNKKSGRGFSGDLLIFDEAQHLEPVSVGAMGPTMSAMPNPQTWYTGSAPHADSLVFHGTRDQGIAGEGERLLFAEWGNEPDVALDDHDALIRVNPGWPHRLTPDNIEGEKLILAHLPAEYLRERMGVAEKPDFGAGIFPPGTWDACRDDLSKPAGKVALALDVAPNMTWASFAVAGLREDGLLHIELVRREAGTDWVISEAAQATRKLGTSVALDPNGPAGALIKDLTTAGVPTQEMKSGQFPRACAALQEKVITGTVRFITQGPLDDAVAGAAIRPAGDSWRWSRSSSQVDISPLVAVTVAAWAEGNSPPAKFISLADI